MIMRPHHLLISVTEPVNGNNANFPTKSPTDKLCGLFIRWPGLSRADGPHRTLSSVAWRGLARERQTGRATRGRRHGRRLNVSGEAKRGGVSASGGQWPVSGRNYYFTAPVLNFVMTQR